jgi:hypothetical protein
MRPGRPRLAALISPPNPQIPKSPGLISFAAIGLEVDDEAMQEASASCALANTLLAQLFPALLAAFQSEVEEVSLPLVPFMTAYVNRLKNVQKRCGARL